MAKVVIIYDSRSGNTGMIAKAIEEGIKDPEIEVLCKRAVNARAEDVRNAGAVVLGSPTYHRDMMASMKTFLFELEKADLKGKIGAAFGSYGWSGESIQMLTDTLKHIFGMEVVEPGLRILRTPTENGLEQCRGFGKEIARKVTQWHER